MYRIIKTKVLISCLLIFLTACSSSSENSNAPVIEDFGEQSVFEKSTFTYRISASDSDGGVAKKEWKQISGTPVEIIGSLSFVAPEITENEELKFEVSVTDNSGNITRKTLTVMLLAYASLEETRFEDEALQACFQWVKAENKRESAISGPDLVSELENDDLTEVKVVTLWNDIGDVNKMDCLGYDIADISEVSRLPNLGSLFLGSNDLVDISALADLDSLKTLYIYNSLKITDFSVLPALENLNNLRLKRVAPSSLNILPDMKRLSFLQLIDIAIDTHNASNLAALTGLKTLLLENNKLTNLDALAGMVEMTELRVKNKSNLISSFQPLTALTELTTLHLENSAVTDLSPLTSMTKLQSFHLNGGAPTSFTVLSDLKNITDLHLKGMPISDTSFLEGMTWLTSLVLSDNGITSLHSLSELINLEELRLYKSDIATFQPLENLTKISILKVFEVMVSDVSAIKNMPEMRVLKLLGTRVADISVLASLSKLEGLSLGRSKVTDLEPLTKLPKLEAFIYLKIGLTDLSVINDFQTLKILKLSEPNDIDHSPIYTWSNLKELNIQLSSSFGCDELVILEDALPNTDVTAPALTCG